MVNHSIYRTDDAVVAVRNARRDGEAGIHIGGVIGLSEAQRVALLAVGALEILLVPSRE